MNKEIMDKSEKIRTNFAKIIVSGTREKPYYEIMYFDHPKNEMCIGYSSYNLKCVFRWLEDIFEVVEEKDEPMEKQNKPRICEVLGVEVRERFDTECYKDAFIERDGTVRTNFRCLMDSDRVCEIINHPDRIIRKPRFTEDEVAMARLIKEKYPWANYIARMNGSLYFVELAPKFNGWNFFVPETTGKRTPLPREFMPSIQIGQSVSIKDIVGCGNE